MKQNFSITLKVINFYFLFYISYGGKFYLDNLYFKKHLLTYCDRASKITYSQNELILSSPCLFT